MYCDDNNDMVADPPTEQKKWKNPSTAAVPATTRPRIEAATRDVVVEDRTRTGITTAPRIVTIRRTTNHRRADVARRRDE